MDWVLLGIPAGIVLLYLGSEWLVKGGKSIAVRMGIAPFVIGLTILAFGSSAPECITSIVSRETPDIIMGNVVGSNIANVGLCIGLAALICPMAAPYRPIRTEMLTMVISTLVVMVFCLSGAVGFVEGIVLLLALVLFLCIVYRLKRNDAEGQKSYTAEVEDEDLWSRPVSAVMIVVGLVALYFGARFFVDGATDLARILGVSELLIGLIVVAVGTSLPELCICLIAAYHGENDMAVSNIVGSIIFNCFAVLGIGALLTDVPASENVLLLHIPAMVLFTVAMFACVRWKGGIGRPAGALLLLGYITYTAVIAVFPSLTM